jgi:hypothetical protein
MPNANKVTLPREVAEAINFLRNKIGVTNFGIIAGIEEGERGYDEWTTVEQYASDKPDTLLAALVNGYEVEKSSEDIIRDDYEQCDPGSLEYRLGFRWGVEKTLNTLGIKIEGVNTE